jgi:methylglutamate dehydrogenase subunit C
VSGPYRLDRGGRIDRSRRLGFRFDGRPYQGHPGDTLASALLANGVRLLGRSFKYHRPRGVVAAGAEEPCALVELRAGPRREANVPMTTIELFEGLEARSQNRWPSLSFDVGAVNGLLAPLIPAGFYYKTFMWPARFWERIYEPAIRRAAGLGRAAREPDPDPYETIHAHCDLLVIGAGENGLKQAEAGARSGRRVILLERDFDAGGQLLLDPSREMERQERLAALAMCADMRILLRTTAFGIYDHGVVGAVERVSDHLPEPPPGTVRQRQWVIRAAEVVHATGGVERIIAFPGNDRPGVMLAGAAETYAVRYGVAAGSRAVFFVTDDGAYRSVFALAERGVAIASVVDVRPGSEAGERAQRAGIPVRFEAEIARTVGSPLRGVDVRKVGGGRSERIACDLLCHSGGWSPLTVPGGPSRPGAGFFEVRAPGKAFVDLQNDVTSDDIRLAQREGYEHVEHAKRYTTHGMGTDQGKIGGAVGAAVLAAARGIPAASVGLTTSRPFAFPVAWGALAGAEVGEHFRPKRRLPLHDWHERNGAVFVKIGLWLRPLVYSAARDSSWAPVLAEARAVRRSVGVTDVSSLGKIDVQGRDAPAFLDRIYANTFSTLPVGKARYGLMLREDGMVFDDGTTSRLSDTHFFITTTTANAGSVLEHLEFHRDTVWPDLDVRITDVADQWAQFAVAGPSARAVLSAVVDRDLDDEAFPFMAAGEAAIAGVPGRLFRISFSGELAYEVSVPSASAERVWETILEAGEPFGITPYGLDALNLLRIEKGHVAGSEINGQTTARDLGLERMRKKSGDFVGRVLAQRSALTDPSRLALVGVRVLDPRRTLRAGAHLLAEASSRESLGFVTAACPRTEGEGFIGLALLRGGAKRFGERLHAADPVRGQFNDVEIVPPHFVDPDNERVKSAAGAGARADVAARRGEERPANPARRHISPPSHPPKELRDPREVGVTLAERRLDIVAVTRSPMGPTEKRDGTEPGGACCKPSDLAWRTAKGVEALPISPTTSLLIRPKSTSTPLLGAVRSGLCRCCSAVDQSDAYRVFRLSGPQARWVLSKGCRIDLHPVSFSQHRVARTIIAQIPIVLYQVEEGCFDLFAPATLARSFTDFLTLSAADVGLSWSGTCEDETR